MDINPLRDNTLKYLSPSPFCDKFAVAQDTKEVSGVIPGIGSRRPSTAGAHRRSTNSSDYGSTGGISCSGTGLGSTAATRGSRAARPKSASASRSRSFLEVQGSSTVCQLCLLGDFKPLGRNLQTRGYKYCSVLRETIVGRLLVCFSSKRSWHGSNLARAFVWELGKLQQLCVGEIHGEGRFVGLAKVLSVIMWAKRGVESGSTPWAWNLFCFFL